MLELTRYRWLAMLVVVAVLGVAIAIWRASGGPPQSRIELLRAAFERASAQCYDAYRGPELQACLTGVMKAHLHALDGGTEDDQPEADSEPAPAPHTRPSRL